MLIHLLESNAPRSHSGWTLIFSAALNGALVATGVEITHREPGQPLLPASQNVIYFLPPLPSREQVELVGIHWATGNAPGPGEAPTADKGVLAAGSRERGSDIGQRGETELPQVADSGGPSYGTGGPVYVESELDKAAERDPSSVAPAYPNELRLSGVEGSVAVEFIVDTVGSADLASLKILAATHPGFAQSVREALPKMMFRPAELAGQRVRQLVTQSYRFVIERKEIVAAPVAAGSKKP